MFCPKCGKELREGAAFCNGCGAALLTQKQQSCASAQLEPKNLIVSKAIKIIMIILACCSFVFNFLLRVSWGATAFNIIEWAIVPGIILILVCVFINKWNPSLMIIPMIYPLLLDLFDILVFHYSFGPLQLIAKIFELLFIIFGILTITKRQLPVKIITAISLSLYFLLTLRLYVNMYGRFSLQCIHFILLTAVWFVFILGIKTKPRMKQSISNNEIHASQTSSIMFCPNCGNRFPLGKRFCDQCGGELKEMVVTNNTIYNQTNPQDSKSTGFGVLGFFFPAIGLILYLVWKDSMPLRAKSTGKGALAGAITWVALTILIYVVYFIIIASLF